MAPKDDLERAILESYKIIRDYEDIIRTSEKPEEKVRARRMINEQWSLVEGYLTDYRPLVDGDLPADIDEIATLLSARTFPSAPLSSSGDERGVDARPGDGQPEGQARVSGSGATAQRDSAAADAGGVAMGGHVHGPVIVAQEGSQVSVTTPGEKVAGQKPGVPWKWVVGIGAVVILVVLAVALGSGLLDRGQQTPTATMAAQIATARVTVPSPTDTPIPAPTNTSRPTPTNMVGPSTSTPAPTNAAVPPPALAATGATWIREKDAAVMVYVPAGEFWMGKDDSDPAAADDEKPRHKVYVDAFWIDRTEVTNAQYRKCVDAGACSPPYSSKSYTRDSYYDDPEFDDYPVVLVTWYQAQEYAAWVGGRLPTEAEWEYAARGPNGRIYPWGDAEPDDSLLNYNDSVGDTTAVGSYPDGASWCGALDMAGNVWEWVADWYDGGYYADSPDKNPLGPDAGNYRVVRSGSFYTAWSYARCSHRDWLGPHSRIEDYGFRVCVVAQ